MLVVVFVDLGCVYVDVLDFVVDGLIIGVKDLCVCVGDDGVIFVFKIGDVVGKGG